MGSPKLLESITPLTLGKVLRFKNFPWNCEDPCPRRPLKKILKNRENNLYNGSQSEKLYFLYKIGRKFTWKMKIHVKLYWTYLSSQARDFVILLEWLMIILRSRQHWFLPMIIHNSVLIWSLISEDPCAKILLITHTRTPVCVTFCHIVKLQFKMFSFQ